MGGLTFPIMQNKSLILRNLLASLIGVVALGYLIFVPGPEGWQTGHWWLVGLCTPFLLFLIFRSVILFRSWRSTTPLLEVREGALIVQMAFSRSPMYVIPLAEIQSFILDETRRRHLRIMVRDLEALDIPWLTRPSAGQADAKERYRQIGLPAPLPRHEHDLHDLADALREATGKPVTIEENASSQA